jgi:hypothetical protein
VAEQALDISLLKDLQRGKPVSPARRRDAVRFLVKRRRVAERRACHMVGNIVRRSATSGWRPSTSCRLVKRMNELAATHPR